MESADHPLLLEPHLAERVWSGRTLGQGIGEAWDLSVHPHGSSTIANGPLKGRSLADLSAASPEDFGGPIGLLAKRLDCGRDLSIQVHPKEGEPKTEAWVVLTAAPHAGIYHGSKTPVTPEQARAAALDGSLPQLLRFFEVRPGQCIFVPTGTVHAIGAGLMLFELQQSADTTYRLFDWGRGRELHLDEALACADWAKTEALPKPIPGPGGRTRLVECEHFFIDRLDTRAPHPLDPFETWIAGLVVEGRARLGDLELQPANTFLLPRAAGCARLEPAPTCSVLLYGPGPGPGPESGHS